MIKYFGLWDYWYINKRRLVLKSFGGYDEENNRL